jgi:hypothetical protein
MPSGSGSAAFGTTRAGARFTPWTATTCTAGVVSRASACVVRHTVVGSVDAAERVVRKRAAAAAFTVRLQLLRAVAEIGA